MVGATSPTRQQQKIDEIVLDIMFIKTYSITNDSHGYLLLLGQQYYAYHLSHTHVHAVAVSQSFGKSLHTTVSENCI
jgi:hypothetical protein